MNNTIMTSKNTFEGGLVMDFSPSNTQANTLTSALNATFITFNGNEMNLQNDMGNGRVETARLPEGYVPVGSCEFGDIIYIVSYNPILNKSQIGCFPSPERNISSDETSECSQSLQASDFQELDNQGQPTGKIKNNSVKRIVYMNTLHPGDKYVIYNEESSIDSEAFKYFSDYKSNGLDSIPRFLKAHVVAIEDGGKINILDSSVKWYGDEGEKYFLPKVQTRADSSNIDIDSYRDLVSSSYSIFSSKVSGKLALLVELEKINGFNSTYEVYKTPENDFKVFWNFNWTTDNEYINISNVEVRGNIVENTNLTNFTEMYSLSRAYKPEGPEELDIDNYNSFKNVEVSRFIPNGSTYPIHGYYQQVSEGVQDAILVNNKHYKTFPYDDILNNIHKRPIYKECNTEFTKNQVLNYQLVPAMPYGYLEEFAQSGTIDFSKVGSGEINLHTWKYYNTEDVSTITLGLDVYPETNKNVAEIILEFYDNQGIAAAYHINNKNSYSGTFTEYIPLNGVNAITKLNNSTVNAEGAIQNFYHRGVKINELQNDSIVYLNDCNYIVASENNTWYCVNDENNKYELQLENNVIKYRESGTETWINFNNDEGVYTNDAGTLYSNFLYGVKIIARYGYISSNNEILNTTNIVFERWFWSNHALNERYYDTKDFKDALLHLTLDVGANYSTTNSWNNNIVKLNAPVINSDSDTLYNNLSATVQQISGNNNIMSEISLGLQDNYNTFYLNAETLKENFTLNIIKGKQYIEDYNGEVVQTGEAQYNIFEGIYPVNDTEPTLITYPILIDAYDNKRQYNGYYKGLICESTNVELQILDQYKNIIDFESELIIYTDLPKDTKISIKGVSEAVTYIGKQGLCKFTKITNGSFQIQSLGILNNDTNYNLRLEFKNVKCKTTTFSKITNNYIIFDKVDSNQVEVPMSYKTLIINYSDNLWSDKWRDYKNSYYLQLQNNGKSETELNYINYNQEEINLSNYNYYNCDLSTLLEQNDFKIKIPLTFNSIHFSKYYKEIISVESTIPTLTNLINTTKDLSKYNLKIIDGHLYFKNVFTVAGNWLHDRSFGLLGLWSFNNDKTFSKIDAINWHNGKGNCIGMTKYAHCYKEGATSYWCIWNQCHPWPILGANYLKDLMPGAIVPILLTYEGEVRQPVTRDGLSRYGIDIEIPNQKYINTFQQNSNKENIGNFWGYNNVCNFTDLIGGPSIACFLMKDVDGEIHAINNLIPLKYNNNSLTQEIYYNNNIEGLPLTIGDLAASILSNIYVVDNQETSNNALKISNIITLDNQQSQYSNDIIYEFKINKITNNQHHSLLLIHNVSLQEYLATLQNFGFVNPPQIFIEDIIKNAPIQFNFNYISPDKINEQIQGNSVAIKRAEKEDIEVMEMKYNPSTETMFYINSFNTIKQVGGKLEYKHIQKVKCSDEGFVTYSYSDEYINHSAFEYFTFKNQLLTLINTSYSANQLYGLGVYDLTERMNGIVKEEYLTELGKYV